MIENGVEKEEVEFFYELDMQEGIKTENDSEDPTKWYLHPIENLQSKFNSKVKIH